MVGLDGQVRGSPAPGAVHAPAGTPSPGKKSVAKSPGAPPSPGYSPMSLPMGSTPYMSTSPQPSPYTSIILQQDSVVSPLQPAGHVLPAVSLHGPTTAPGTASLGGTVTQPPASIFNPRPMAAGMIVGSPRPQYSQYMPGTSPGGTPAPYYTYGGVPVPYSTSSGGPPVPYSTSGGGPPVPYCVSSGPPVPYCMSVGMPLPDGVPMPRYSPGGTPMPYPSTSSSMQTGPVYSPGPTPLPYYSSGGIPLPTRVPTPIGTPTGSRTPVYGYPPDTKPGPVYSPSTPLPYIPSTLGRGVTSRPSMHSMSGHQLDIQGQMADQTALDTQAMATSTSELQVTMTIGPDFTQTISQRLPFFVSFQNHHFQHGVIYICYCLADPKNECP
jgi:hypothetical protein